MIKILTVDNDPNDLFLMERALAPLEADCRLFIAKNGVEAQERLMSMTQETTESLTVIITDLDMPRLDGLQFLRWAKSDDRFRDIPVVMISSFDNRAQINTAFELGAVACMLKPPTRSAVKALVRTIARMEEAKTRSSVSHARGDF